MPSSRALVRALCRRAERRLVWRDWGIAATTSPGSGSDPGDTPPKSQRSHSSSSSSSARSRRSDASPASSPSSDSDAGHPDFLHPNLAFVHHAGRGIGAVATAAIPSGTLLIREVCYAVPSEDSCAHSANPTATAAAGVSDSASSRDGGEAAAEARLPHHICEQLHARAAAVNDATGVVRGGNDDDDEQVLRRLCAGGLALLSPRLPGAASLPTGELLDCNSWGADTVGTLLVRDPPSTEAARTALARLVNTGATGPCAGRGASSNSLLSSPLKSSPPPRSMPSSPQVLLAHMSEVCARNATYTVNVDGRGSCERAARLPIKRSLLNHACRANAATLHSPPAAAAGAAGGDSGGADAVCYVRTVRDIEAGEEITVEYIAGAKLLQPTEARRAHLQQAWGFECNCPWCAGEDNNDDGASTTTSAAASAADHGSTSGGSVSAATAATATEGRRVNEVVAAVRAGDLSAGPKLELLCAQACEGRLLPHHAFRLLEARAFFHRHVAAPDWAEVFRSVAATEAAAVDAAGGVPAAHPMRLPCAVAASVCGAMGIAPTVRMDSAAAHPWGDDGDDDGDDDDGLAELRRALQISDTAYGGGWELFQVRWGDMLRLLPADVVAETRGHWHSRTH